MVITITNLWKLFSCGFKIYHYEKLIVIRELLKLLALDCFSNPFSTDNGTPSNNIPPLDYVDEVETFSTCHALYFSSYISTSVEDITISDITINIASSISYISVTYTIGSHNTAEIEEAREGGIYNRLNRSYCSGRFPNENIFLKRTLWFLNGCAMFSNKTY